MSDRVKAIILVLVVFVLGTLFGAGLGYLLMSRSLPFTGREPAPWVERRSRSGNEARQLRHLFQLLDPTPEQQQELRSILKKSQERYRQAIREHRLRLDQLRRETRGEIEAILTPEQKEKFQQFLEEQRRSRSRQKDHRDRD